MWKMYYFIRSLIPEQKSEMAESVFTQRKMSKSAERGAQELFHNSQVSITKSYLINDTYISMM